MDHDARFNLARWCLAENARLRGDRTALIVADGAGGPALEMSAREVERAVLSLAGGLTALGLPKGSRIVLRMGNEADTILCFFAIVAAGHVAVPTSTMLTPDEARFVAADSEAAAVILGREASNDRLGAAAVVDPERLAALKRSAPLADYADTFGEDPAYLVYTSGTTGRPKGVLHAHRVALGRRPMHDHWLGLAGGDVVLHAGAFNWTYTIGVGVLDPFACGATAVLARDVSAPSQWLDLIARHGVTIFAAVPGVYRQILKRGWAEGRAVSPTLRHGVSAGEALQTALLDEWRAATGLEIYEAFGMSEVSTFVSSSPTTPARPGTPGRPQPGRRVAALHPDGGVEPLPAGATGVLAVHRSDPGLMLGYWRRPEEDTAAFRGDWFVSGDLVSFDDDGYMRHHGRHDDVMNALGYRVSPQEVEDAIAAHPSVAEVGVTEQRVRDDLTLIAAFVVLKEGMSADETALAAFCTERLASYKRPKLFHFVEALPRSANGKLQRRRLAETIA